MKNKEKKRFKISYRLIVCIFLLSIIICVSTCFIGYRQYRRTIERLYNENGYVIGNVVLDIVDGDKIVEYSKTFKEDEYYSEMSKNINDLKAASGVAYIFISVPKSDGTVDYIFDTGDVNMGIDPYEIGVNGPIYMFQDEIMQIFSTGEPIYDNYFVRNSPAYGEMTSSILPIKDSDGNTVALLSVDIAMTIIRETLLKYIYRTILISVLLMVTFAVISLMYMRKSVVKPLKTIETSLMKFADNSDSITEELNSIKTNDEFEDLSKTIYKMEGTILNYIDNITKITAEKERIGAELNIATKIQADMLPSIFPAFPGRAEFDIYASMCPAKEVGGDFYDFFMIDDNHVGLVMADVSGKGVPAALFMVISKTLIKNRTLMGGKPSEILSHVNNQLCENNETQMFVTCWLGILDITTGVITAASAGHEFPAVKHKGGKYELLKDKHGFVLAGLENAKYKDYEINLEPGDAFYIYTDGVAEATNKDNELFGTDRMVDALNVNPDAECKDILDNVQAGIDAFVKDADQFDDITMLCLEYFGKEGR